MQRSTAWPAGLLLAALLAACGGGTGGGSATGAPAKTDEPAATTASSGSTPTAAPTIDAGGGGGPTGGVCDLATTDELATVFGVAVTATAFEGPPDTCMIEDAEGAVLVSWVYTTQNAQGVFDAVASDPGQATAVTGLGDRAAFVENTGLLILKGNGLTTIVISGMSGLSGDEATDAARKVGAFIAGRM